MSSGALQSAYASQSDRETIFDNCIDWVNITTRLSSFVLLVVSAMHADHANKSVFRYIAQAELVSVLTHRRIINMDTSA